MSFFKQLVEDYFKVYSVTDEDKKKTEQYKQNAARAQAQASFTDFDSFLESLDIQITMIAPVIPLSPNLSATLIHQTFQPESTKPRTSASVYLCVVRLN